jgi:GntR family transcriptional regulator/MocR family aminotransferase
MDLVLPPRTRDMPATQWLRESIRGEILAGRLRPGTRVPSTRELAIQFDLSRGTVVDAIEQLGFEGYLEGVVGSGTFVTTSLPDELLQLKPLPGHVQAQTSPPRRRLSNFARRAQPYMMFDPRVPRAFRTNLPALSLFPTELWTQVTARRLRRAPATLFLGCETFGYRPLRSTICDYLCNSRGVSCTPDQVVITSGIQESLDLVTRVFVNPGETVYMEEPGYPGAAQVFEAAGAALKRSPVDNEGLEIPPGGFHDGSLIYITPGHQFPLGVTMSIRRRLELLDSASRSNCLILEDDYDSEFRYSGHPVPSLQGLDQRGIVLFGGSFSKMLFPSIRVGFLVVPSDLVDRVEAVKSLTNRYAPVIDQAILNDFIAEGHFGRHIRRMRQVYGERLSVLLDLAQKELAGELEVSPVQAGLQTVGWIKSRFNSTRLAKEAEQRNIELSPLSRYGTSEYLRKGISMGFASIEPTEIRRGIKELAAIVEKLRTGRR